MIAPPGQRPRGIAEAEALFAEARRRRRHRRLAAGVTCLLLAGLVAAGLTAWSRRGAVRSGAPAAGRAPDITLPPTRVAWVNYGGQLHLGNLATRTQHVVATVDASAGDPMILASGHLYWASTSKNVAPIRDYDIATGRIRYLARGDSVFASADGRHIYIVQTATTLIELPAAGIGRPRRLTLPAGWHMSGDLGNWAVAGGIVVYSVPADQGRHPSTLAVWTPGTGHVKIIGRDLGITDTYTPRGASYSLLAWTSHRVLGITNTSTLASLTVRSPYRYGFTYGGPVLPRRILPRREAPGGVHEYDQSSRPLHHAVLRAGHRQHQDRGATAGSRGQPGDHRGRGLGPVAARRSPAHRRGRGRQLRSKCRDASRPAILLLRLPWSGHRKLRRHQLLRDHPALPLTEPARPLPAAEGALAGSYTLTHTYTAITGLPFHDAYPASPPAATRCLRRRPLDLCPGVRPAQRDGRQHQRLRVERHLQRLFPGRPERNRDVQQRLHHQYLRPEHRPRCPGVP